MVDISGFVSSNVYSHPILHDIVKSFLVRDAEYILKTICPTIPDLKYSRIFKPTTPHKFFDAREEWFVDGFRYPADAVWRFKSIYKPNDTIPSYYIIHEVKTGNYDLETEMEKHYVHKNHTLFYIWAHPYYHRRNPKVPHSYVKQIDINVLQPYIIKNTIEILKQWNDSVGGDLI